jgi:type IX secretion system PorP/SprF family membrane protein
MRTRGKHTTVSYFKLSCLSAAAFILSLLQTVSLQAQDLHFSQFYAAPMLINPANTGTSGDGLRVANIYRNQWAKIGIPYETVSTSLDKNLTIAGHSFGIGGFILHDQSSSFNLAENAFMISLSYSRMFRNQMLTIGIQPGYVLKSYNLTGITFGSQFSDAIESFDASLPALESGLSDRLSYFDLNAGIAWRTMIGNIMPMAGFSLDHINVPLQKFSTSSKGTRLHMKMNATGGIFIPVNDRIALNPVIIYTYTSGTDEFLLGSTGDYSLARSDNQVRKVYAVTMLRVNPVRNLDAIIVGGGAEFFNFNLGISYDLNISPLRSATNFRGAFEVTLVYTGKGRARFNKGLPCYIIN